MRSLLYDDGECHVSTSTWGFLLLVLVFGGALSTRCERRRVDERVGKNNAGLRGRGCALLCSIIIHED